MHSVLVPSEQSCGLWESLRNPLLDERQNYLNPCFLASAVFYTQAVFGALALCQIFTVLCNNCHGVYPIKYSFGSPWKTRSVGIRHFLRVAAAALQALLYGALFCITVRSSRDSRALALAYSFLVCTFLVLPLQFLETTRSVVGHASVVLYWMFSAGVFLVVNVSDTLSPHKVFAPVHDKSAAALAATLQTLLLLNAVAAYLLETHLYQPSVELREYFDLCDWDITTVQNVIQKITFLWVEPTLKQVEETGGAEAKDLHNIIEDLKSVSAEKLFQDAWAKELKRAAWWRDRRVRGTSNASEADRRLRPSVFLTILRIHKVTFCLGILTSLVDCLCSVTAPFLLQKFILFIYYSSASSGEAPPLIKGVLLAVGIYMCSVVRYVTFNQNFIMFFYCSYSIRSSLTGAIYGKAMNLSPESKSAHPTGDIINHVSTDISAISNSIDSCSDAVSIPLRLAFILAALYKLVGNAMWAGLATAVVLAPFSSLINTKELKLFEEQMEYKDQRTKLTNEILNAVKSIKLYAWENPMMKKLDDIRNKKELTTIRRMGIFSAASSFLWESIPFAVSCVVYAVYTVVTKQTLVPSIVFPALSLFDLLTVPITMLPSIISSMIEAKVSLERVAKFFTAEELDEYVQNPGTSLRPGDVSVSIENANFVWSAKSEGKESEPALRNINFTAKKGQLTCIAGRVGSGKTTLLKTMLSEIPLAKDANTTITVNGKIAYCSQNPCIFNTSIRENILFGKKYDPVFYNKTVDACQLLSDFEVLPHGDATPVGEKGISLSGGQKARVSLARALYSKADVYLLDDVLSAVDAHVGKKIIQHVLGPQGLLASKTLILATNSLRVLRFAQRIVFLEKGEILENGTFDELMTTKGHVAELMNEFSKEETEETEEPETEAPVEDNVSEEEHDTKPYNPTAVCKIVEAGGAPLMKIASHNTIGASSAVSFGHEYEFENEYIQRRQKKEEKENNVAGRVQWKVYAEFLKACNWYFILVWVLFFWAVVGMNILGNWILKSWSEKNLASGENLSPALYLSIYASTGVAGGLLTFISAYIIWTFCAVRSSTHFHDKMVLSVLRSPMSFFDTTPIGRILNRFTDDLTVLDQQVLWSFIMFVSFLIECFSRIAIVIYNLPFMIVVILVLAYFYNYFRMRFMPTSRELKRLRSAARSPMFSHLQESVNGVETIRAYKEQQRFIYGNRIRADEVVKIEWTMQGANRWLSMRLQSTAALIVLSSTLMILVQVHLGRKISASLAGFIMTYVFSSTSTLNAIIRLWADVEAKAVNIERLIEYCNLPSEAEPVLEENRPESHWPALGEIHFNDYSTRYREHMDPVLKNINLDIKPSEKIGIVGRTGAGKSSLTLALFRLIEPTTGNITVDKINSSEIGLFDLRSKLNIIPQDAHAFDGSVRENLDPFGQYTDERLWEVLEMAHLKEHIESMKTEEKLSKKAQAKKKDDDKPKMLFGLDAQVSEGGSNLSSGQKQLLCLARALLKESKVLVLDEATAAVDVRTDKIIQQTIRTAFKDKTILTIAHRLDTIMDSDRVLVLDRGQVKEFDSPENLLKDEASEFYSLCKEGGYLGTS